MRLTLYRLKCPVKGGFGPQAADRFYVFYVQDVGSGGCTLYATNYLNLCKALVLQLGGRVAVRVTKSRGNSKADYKGYYSGYRRALLMPLD